MTQEIICIIQIQPMLRLNLIINIIHQKSAVIQIQPMLRLNCQQYKPALDVLSIQIQPMLRLNLFMRQQPHYHRQNSNTTNVKVKHAVSVGKGY